MTAVNLLLLLMVPLLGANAEPQKCDILNNTLPIKDLDKVMGSWVLDWAVSKGQYYQEIMNNVSSSLMEFHLSPDNSSIRYTERNLFKDKTCCQFFMNLTMPADRSSSDHHKFPVVFERVLKNGVPTEYNDTSTIEFLYASSQQILMVYKGVETHLLLSYRKLGGELNIGIHGEMRNKAKNAAECLGFPVDHPFEYDGITGFCPEPQS